MVIGLLVLTSIPTVTGISLGVREQGQQEARKKDARRMRKFNITVYSASKAVRDKVIVLRDGKVFIDELDPQKRVKPAYLAEAFYIEYPDKERVPMEMGLVTQVSDDPPMLNWVYVQNRTGELRYGNRTESKPHRVGDWDWTEDEVGITFEGEEAFVAVEGSEKGEWQVYLDDIPGDSVRDRMRGKRVLEISLERKMVDDSSQK